MLLITTYFIFLFLFSGANGVSLNPFGLFKSGLKGWMGACSTIGVEYECPSRKIWEKAAEKYTTKTIRSLMKEDYITGGCYEDDSDYNAISMQFPDGQRILELAKLHHSTEESIAFSSADLKCDNRHFNIHFRIFTMYEKDLDGILLGIPEEINNLLYSMGDCSSKSPPSLSEAQYMKENFEELTRHHQQPKTFNSYYFMEYINKLIFWIEAANQKVIFEYYLVRERCSTYFGLSMSSDVSKKESIFEGELGTCGRDNGTSVDFGVLHNIILPWMPFTYRFSEVTHGNEEIIQNRTIVVFVGIRRALSIYCNHYYLSSYEEDLLLIENLALFDKENITVERVLPYEATEYSVVSEKSTFLINGTVNREVSQWSHPNMKFENQTDTRMIEQKTTFEEFPSFNNNLTIKLSSNYLCNFYEANISFSETEIGLIHTTHIFNLNVKKEGLLNFQLPLRSIFSAFNIKYIYDSQDRLTVHIAFPSSPEKILFKVKTSLNNFESSNQFWFQIALCTTKHGDNDEKIINFRLRRAKQNNVNYRSSLVEIGFIGNDATIWEIGTFFSREIPYLFRELSEETILNPIRNGLFLLFRKDLSQVLTSIPIPVKTLYSMISTFMEHSGLNKLTQIYRYEELAKDLTVRASEFFEYFSEHDDVIYKVLGDEHIVRFSIEDVVAQIHWKLFERKTKFFPDVRNKDFFKLLRILKYDWFQMIEDWLFSSYTLVE